MSAPYLSTLPLPNRTTTAFSAFNPPPELNGSEPREHDASRLPSNAASTASQAWSRLAKAFEAHDDEEITGCSDDVDTLLTFVRFILSYHHVLSRLKQPTGRPILCCCYSVQR